MATFVQFKTMATEVEYCVNRDFVVAVSANADDDTGETCKIHLAHAGNAVVVHGSVEKVIRRLGSSIMRA